MTTEVEKLEEIDVELGDQGTSLDGMNSNISTMKNTQTDGTQKTQIVNSTGDSVSAKTNMNTSNVELLVNLEGHLCEDNTTNTPLGANITFAGDWQDTIDYGVISVAVKADKDSATDGLLIEWSPDQTIIADTDQFTISANIGKVFSFGPASRYVRIKYTNGGDPQTVFGLQTLLRRTYVKPSSHRIQDSIVAEDDAELVKAVITGLTPAGSFKNVQVTNNGNQKVSIEEFENNVSTNSSTQLNVTHYSASGYPADVDGTTYSIQTIDYAHKEIHSSNHYFVKGYVELDDGSDIDFCVVSPNTTKWAHLTFKVASTGKTTIEVYENSTFTNAGTPVVAVNNNRNSANTSGLTIATERAIDSIGSKLSESKFGTSTVSGRPAGSGITSREDEVILKQNTGYIFRFISGTDGNVIDYRATWYEHTNNI